MAIRILNVLLMGSLLAACGAGLEDEAGSTADSPELGSVELNLDNPDADGGDATEESPNRDRDWKDWETVDCGALQFKAALFYTLFTQPERAEPTYMVLTVIGAQNPGFRYTTSVHSSDCDNGVCDSSPWRFVDAFRTTHNFSHRMLLRTSVVPYVKVSMQKSGVNRPICTWRLNPSNPG